MTAHLRTRTARLHAAHRDATTMSWRERLDTQDGFSAGAEVLLFGTLIFFVGFLLVINTWNVIDADMAVTAAAREAARTYVESNSGATADDEARAAAADALQSLGRSQPHTVTIDGALVRCQRVDVTVRMQVDPVRLPGGAFSNIITVQSTHSELVDPFRSGLSGTASCP